MRGARGGATKKGFARRRQRFLEGPYVAIPACGGEWEWEWWRAGVRQIKVSHGAGSDSWRGRMQRFLHMEESGYG